jgi:SAM-dependent methyltransferase
VSRIEQHLKFLDSRILDKQVHAAHYERRCVENLDLILNRDLLKPGERALEVGIGNGFMLELFAKRGIIATGVCKSKDDYEECRRRGLEVCFCDMSDMPFEDATFDFIYTRNAFDHSPMPPITLCEFRRVLKPDKFMFIEFEIFSPEDVERHPEVRRIHSGGGGSYNKHRHWSPMTWDQMRWLLRRLDLELVDSFFAHESQAFIVKNTPFRSGGGDILDKWGHIGSDSRREAEKRKITLRRLYRHPRLIFSLLTGGRSEKHIK